MKIISLEHILHGFINMMNFDYQKKYFKWDFQNFVIYIPGNKIRF